MILGMILFEKPIYISYLGKYVHCCKYVDAQEDFQQRLPVAQASKLTKPKNNDGTMNPYLAHKHCIPVENPLDTFLETQSVTGSSLLHRKCQQPQRTQSPIYKDNTRWKE